LRQAAIEDAIINYSTFNIIDYTSGFKADFVVLKNEPFRQTEFERRTVINFLEMNVYVVSAEDLLISKLAWIQEYAFYKMINSAKTAVKAKQNTDNNQTTK
jgi:hypothetical protein